MSKTKPKNKTRRAYNKFGLPRKRYMSVNELACFLNRSREFVCKLVKDGHIIGDVYYPEKKELSRPYTKRLLKIDEVAECIGCSRTKVYKLIKERKILALKDPYSRRYFGVVPTSITDYLRVLWRLPKQSKP